MTTIAIKDGIVAADMQETSPSQTRVGSAHKLRRLESGEVIGLLGKAVHAYPLAEWYEKGKQGDQPEGSIIVVKPTGDVDIYEDGGVQPTGRHELRAFGSGADLATGAMAAGASAEQAVQIAIAFDIWSGGPVQTIALEADAPAPASEAEEVDEEDDIIPVNFAAPNTGEEPAPPEDWKTRRGLA